MTIVHWLAVAVAGVVIFFVILKKRQNALDASIMRRFEGKNVRLMDKYALFIAQQSDGYSHTRGTGYLVLTDEELFFERVLGRKQVSMPLNRILEVGETWRLAGQSPGRLMLKVEFRNDQQETDAIALRVKELERWKSAIASEARIVSNG
jgi:hypothetical protein